MCSSRKCIVSKFPYSEPSGPLGRRHQDPVHSRRAFCFLTRIPCPQYSHMLIEPSFPARSCPGTCFIFFSLTWSPNLYSLSVLRILGYHRCNVCVTDGTEPGKLLCCSLLLARSAASEAIRDVPFVPTTRSGSRLLVSSDYSINLQTRRNTTSGFSLGHRSASKLRSSFAP